MDILLIIFKWAFVIAAVIFSAFLYKQETAQLSLIRKNIKDKKIVSEFSRSAKHRVFYLFVMIAVFAVWMITYDFKVEDVTKTNVSLARKLQDNTGSFENLGNNVARLSNPSQAMQTDIEQDIINFYSEIVLNHYVLRKCQIAADDDIFIINSAMLREIILNGATLSNRDIIIRNAKANFNKNYSNFACSNLHGKFNEIITSYQNYIIATREALRSTLN